MVQKESVKRLFSLLGQLLDRVRRAGSEKVFRPLALAEGDSWTIPEQPRPVDQVWQWSMSQVFEPGMNGVTGRHLAYIPGGSLWDAAFAEMVAAMLNPYSALEGVNPGAVQIENQVLDWLKEVVGFPAEAAGCLVSGGSLAHVVALMAAREAIQLKPEEIPRKVVYFSDQAHHSFEKALKVLGLDTVKKQKIPTDANFRIKISDLEWKISADLDAGFQPWLLMASAGTTNTGAIDPLEVLAEVCKSAGLWFHVDGAYGAPFRLCPSLAAALAGLERADSLILDPHKGLSMPFGSGCALVRKGQYLQAANRFEAAYVQDAVVQERRSPADFSPEFTRPFRAFPLWFCLQIHGVSFFRSALEEKRVLALRAYEWADQQAEFWLGPQPDLTVITLRYRFQRIDLDQGNRRLADLMRQDGDFFISGTDLPIGFVLRIAILTHRSTWSDVLGCLEALLKRGRELEGQTA